MDAVIGSLKDLGILAALGSVFGGVAKLWFTANSQRRVINKAVLAEIKALLVVLHRHREWWSSYATKQDAPLIPFLYPVYAKQLENVGLLDNDIVSQAVQFYGYVQFINELQKTRVQYPADQFTNFDDLYSHSLRNCEERFGDKFDEAFARYAIAEMPPVRT